MKIRCYYIVINRIVQEYFLNCFFNSFCSSVVQVLFVSGTYYEKDVESDSKFTWIFVVY